MDKTELLEILDQGEDYYTEFKEEGSHADDLSAEMVAFANSEGGRLFIGVDDKGIALGVKNADQEMQRMDNLCLHNCEPSLVCRIEKVKMNGALVLVVTIPKGIERPYRTNKGVYYTRTNSGKRQASREELLRLYQATGSFYYDELPLIDTGVPDLDSYYFEKFFEEFHGRKFGDVGINLETLLKSMKIFVSSEERKTSVFSLAGWLLFAKHPQEKIPYAKITVAKFQGKEVSDTFEKKEIEGKLTDQISHFEDITKLYLSSTVKIEGFEKELHYEIPLAVFREFIVNAIVHRDYHICSQIRVFIFEDRIEIISPGRLPNTVTLDNIRWGGIHVERNPIIVSFLAKMGYLTQIGTGIIRSIRLLKEQTGKEPDFEERAEEFVVRIWRPR